MKSFLGAIFGRKQLLFPFEAAMLSDVVEKLSLRVQSEKLRNQIAEVNRVERLTGGKEVNLYVMRGGRVCFNPELEIEGLPEEALLCRAVYSQLKTTKKLKVECWVVTGHLFSLRYSCQPSDYFGQLELTSVSQLPYEIEVGPFFQPNKPDLTQNDTDRPAWLDRTDLSVSVVGKPNAEQVSRTFSQIDAQIPEDLRHALLFSDGLIVGDWKILAAKEIRLVATEHSNYYVIGEVSEARSKQPQTMLAIKQGNQSGEVFLLSFDADGTERPFAVGLTNALLKLA